MFPIKGVNRGQSIKIQENKPMLKVATSSRPQIYGNNT